MQVLVCINILSEKREMKAKVFHPDDPRVSEIRRVLLDMALDRILHGIGK